MAGRITYYGNIVKEGLVLDLDAAKKDSYPGSGTAWRDISGTTITGSLVNGPIFSTSGSGAIVFDGVDDQIILSSIPLITTALTYTAWVYISSFGSNNAVFNIGNTLFELNSTGLSYWSDIYQGRGGAGYSFTTGSWNFISVTQNNTTASFYINGTSIATNAQVAINMSGGSIFLGTYSGGSRFLNGKISSALIYNRALSAAEVLQNYNATKGRYGL